MLQPLASAEDVLALRVSEKITGADLEPIMEHADEVMPRHAKFHV